MKKHRWFLLIAVLLATETVAAPRVVDVNGVAERYVKMVLEVGLYDADYVDAYFGPRGAKGAFFLAPLTRSGHNTGR